MTNLIYNSNMNNSKIINSSSNLQSKSSSNIMAQSLTSLGFLSKESPLGGFIQFPQKEFKNLLKKQTNNRWYNKNLKSKSERLEVIFGYMQKICLVLQLQNSTFCLSVKIFDAVISKFPIELEQMKILGVISIMIGSKMNERHDKVLSLSDIKNYLLPVEIPILASIEQKVFQELNFNLNLITPDTLLQFLLHLFLSNQFNFFEIQTENTEDYSEFLQIVKYLQMITIVDYTFYKFTSIAVATSILIVGRCMLKLDEVWPKQMEYFTGIKIEHVKECIDLLTLRFQNKFLMKVFKKLDQKLSNDSFLVNAKNNFSISQASEKYFMNESCIKILIQSINTICSIKNSFDKI